MLHIMQHPSQLHVGNTASQHDTCSVVMCSQRSDSSKSNPHTMGLMLRVLLNKCDAILILPRFKKRRRKKSKIKLVKQVLPDTSLWCTDFLCYDVYTQFFIKNNNRPCHQKHFHHKPNSDSQHCLHTYSKCGWMELHIFGTTSGVNLSVCF